MSPKLALSILAVIAIIMAGIFSFLYFKQEADKNSKNLKTEIILSEEEKKEKLIEQKISEKYAEIDSKTPEEIKENGFTQEQLDFMANPRQSIEEELGMQPEKKMPKRYTQEELDTMANPQK